MTVEERLKARRYVSACNFFALMLRASARAIQAGGTAMLYQVIMLAFITLFGAIPNPLNW